MLKNLGRILLYNKNAKDLSQIPQKFNNAMSTRSLRLISGPPAHKFTSAQKILIGGGSVLIMSIIPLWGMFSLSSWAEKSKQLGKSNVPKEKEEEKPEEPEADENAESTEEAKPEKVSHSRKKRQG